MKTAEDFATKVTAALAMRVCSHSELTGLIEARDAEIRNEYRPLVEQCQTYISKLEELGGLDGYSLYAITGRHIKAVLSSLPECVRKVVEEG